jgi:signal transduction histidine kinase/ligand-binding sensor domain-containing protein
MVATIVPPTEQYQESGMPPNLEKPVVGFPRGHLVPGDFMALRPTTSALLVVLVLVLGLPLGPVPADAHTTAGYSLMSWTDADGRALGAVYALAEDRDGYLWLGTDAGLFRFDGARFTAWSQLSDDPLPDGSVTALRVASDGSLWVGFDRAGVRKLSNGRDVPIANNSRLDKVTDLVEDRKGTMWVVAEGTLHELGRSGWQPVQLPWKDQPGRVLQPAVLSDGSLWVTTRWGVFRHADDREGFELMSEGHVWGVTSDDKGKVWTTDTVHGFRKLGSTAAPTPGVEGAGYRVLSDCRGDLWIATFADGLWRAKNGQVVDRAGLRTGLSSDTILSLIEDRDGNIWVGTTAGLHRFRARPLTPVQNVGFVLAVEPAADGGMWVATTTALLKMESPTSRSKSRPIPAADVRALFRDERDTLWIGAVGGLWKIERGSSSLVQATATPLSTLTSVSSDGRGGIWLGDESAVMHWDRRRLVSWTRRTSTAPAVTFARADSTGRLWLGHADGRVEVESPDGVRRAVAPAHVDGGRPRMIHALFEDRDGAVWLAGSDGLSRYGNGALSTITVKNGLPDNQVWAIVEDDQRRLWLSMDRGLVRIDRAQLDLALTKPAHRIRYLVYDAMDGVAGAAVGRVRSARAADGSLWFVRGGGLTVVDPTRPDVTVAPPMARIESVTVDGRRLTSMGHTTFESGTKRVQFSFTAVTLTSSHRVQFRYRLDGFDPDWVTAGTRRRNAYYTNLSPGDYRFRVEAQLEDGTWDQSSTNWSFSVRPAFYQTPWFALMAFSIVGSAIWGTWLLRLRMVRGEFAAVLSERMRLSRELHDTLLQSLVGVALQIEDAAQDLAPEATVARSRLFGIRRRVEGHIREVRQSIWDMRSPRSTACLGGAFEEFGRRAVEGTATRFSVVVKGTARRYPTDVETHLLRIGQEAVTNAIRHGNASRIRLTLDYAPRSVTLQVEDDGLGFEASPTTLARGHYGLTTMRERAEHLSGRFRVVSEHGEGTLVEVVVPTPHMDTPVEATASAG